MTAPATVAAEVLARVGDAVALCDGQGCVRWRSDSFATLFDGVVPERAFATELELVHPGERASVRAALDAVRRAPGRSQRMEFRLRQGAARWVWLEATFTNQLEDTLLQSLVVVARDVTERKARELEFERMREILQEGQRIAHLGSFEYVVATHETVWSDEEFRIYGVSPEAGSPDYETMLNTLIHPDDRQLLHETFAEALERRGVYELEHRIVRPDGEVRTVRDLAHPYFDYDGQLYRYVGTTLDITERRELEAQLLQSQKLDSIGRLAGGIAHDFNNLLIPITGYAELASEDLDPGDRRREYLQTVIEAADRASALTSQILAFSRKQILKPRVMDLNQIVASFEQMARRLLGESIELRSVLDGALRPVRVDRSQIEQVLLNLIVNARDAMPDGGHLTIETGNVYLDEAYLAKHGWKSAPGPHAMLAVSDSGCGIDETSRKRVFEPFFTTKPKGQGTGLGLSTVFGIVQQHQGSIFLYSEPGRGTTFKIYLPQVGGDVASEEHSVPSTLPPAGAERILVVEDEPLVGNLVCETLEADGYVVIQAASPREALELLHGSPSPIDLLLTDVVMPELNGRELYERIQAIQPSVPVLFMSGYTDNVIVHQGILDDGIAFLEKPFSLHALRTKVRAVLAGAQAR